LEYATKQCLKAFQEYDFSSATTALYDFILYDYCDNYLEIIKGVMKGDNVAAKEAVSDTVFACMDEALRLLHPLMPFITEELYQRLPRRPGVTIPSIVVAPYPKSVPSRENLALEKDFKQYAFLLMLSFAT